MFGLGLYIYAGEDLPEGEEEEPEKPVPKKKAGTPVSSLTLCDECQKPVNDASIDGKLFTAGKIIEASFSKFGRRLCMDCAKTQKG